MHVFGRGVFYRGWIAALSITLAGATALGQAAPAPDLTPQWMKDAGGKMAFDVVSVKENKGGMVQGNFPNANFPWGSTPTYLPTGGRFSAKNRGLEDIIAFAYKLTGQQITFLLRPKLPAWALDEHFDIEARAPEGPEPSKDQMRLMVQALLADRFQLKLHFETKEGTTYALRLIEPGVLGPKIKPHPPEVDCSKTWYDPKSPETKQPTDGLPANCSYIQTMKPPFESLAYAARGAAIMEIVKMGTVWFNDGRPTVDETGLQGTYDFSLEFSPPAEPMPPLPPNVTLPAGMVRPTSYINDHGAAGSELRDALRKQLGMKFETSKGPVLSLVLDHIEQPSSN